MKSSTFCLGTRVPCIALALGLLSPSASKAADDILQFNYSFSPSGSASSPTGQGPWLTEEIKDVTPGKVDLTITTSGLQGSEFISGFYLNLDPSMNPTSLSFTKLSQTGIFTVPTISLGENAYKADGSGYYDIELGFSTSHGSTFTVGDSIEYQITCSGLDAACFDFKSVMSGGDGTYLAAAHVQSIGSDGSSAWIAPVPEPGSSTLVLVGGGVWFGARRFVSRFKV